ncbi:hypothetical protein M514_10107, partial [Trichuris suis]
MEDAKPTAVALGLSLPEPFADGDFAQWIRHFELCASANGWQDTIKAKKLPTLLKGDALLMFFELPEQVRNNYQDLVDALKAQLNPPVHKAMR